jgi:hypothetical protein
MAEMWISEKTDHRVVKESDPKGLLDKEEESVSSLHIGEKLCKHLLSSDGESNGEKSERQESPENSGSESIDISIRPTRQTSHPVLMGGGGGEQFRYCAADASFFHFAAEINHPRIAARVGNFCQKK